MNKSYQYYCNAPVNNIKSNQFCGNAPVYLFTNENISGYLPHLGNMTGARVLSVCASGDHAFECLLAGASYVDTFDININQKNVVELKTHMIRHLPYEQFLEFFFGTYHFFDPKILNPIRDKFSDDLKDFLFGYKSRGNKMFWYQDGVSPGFDIFKISYLQNPNKYYELREKLSEKISFTNCDIREISTKFTQKYDVILLSNIADYFYTDKTILATDEIISNFYREALVPLSNKNLANDNGRICFQYLWKTYNTAKWDIFAKILQRSVAYRQMHNYHHIIKGTAIKASDRDYDFDYVFILEQNVLQKSKSLAYCKTK